MSSRASSWAAKSADLVGGVLPRLRAVSRDPVIVGLAATVALGVVLRAYFMLRWRPL